MKTHELVGADLNEAVAKCLGIVHTRYNGQVVDQGGNPLMYDDDWSLAGEIIEREQIELRFTAVLDTWYAQPNDMDSVCQRQKGPTPLIAAMRCYVASKQ